MIIATVQMPMAWTPHDNTQTILQSLTKAKELGAEVAVFPECALTGYHVRMGDGVTPGSTAEALNEIGQRCATLKIAAVVGSPYYGNVDQEKPWNAVVIFDDFGRIIAAYPKIVFTSGEIRHGVFEPGAEGSRSCLDLFGRRCAVPICCELGGEKGQAKRVYREILTRLDTRPNLVFVCGTWGMGPDARKPTVRRHACDMAREFRTYVVLTNWPEWGGPPVQAGECMGRSMTISPAGDIISEAPPDRKAIILSTV